VNCTGIVFQDSFTYFDDFFRFTIIFHRNLSNIFTRGNILSIFLSVILFHFFLFLPYYLRGLTGFESMGFCGIVQNDNFTTRVLHPITYGVLLTSYAISTYCGMKVVREIRYLSDTMSPEFPVSSQGFFRR